MASKKTKKKSSAKPAKKKAGGKKAAPAKKAAAKKAAPKKAAPKKAKAAARKAAPAKKPAAKKPAAPKQPKETSKERLATIEVVEAADVMPFESAPAEVNLKSEILSMARQIYGDKSDEELLDFDPNDVDAMDPSMFYELIAEKYGVAADPGNDYFGGFGGPIKNLIAFVESRWDGETRKDTPMPPGEWLEEYVHPES